MHYDESEAHDQYLSSSGFPCGILSVIIIIIIMIIIIIITTIIMILEIFVAHNPELKAGAQCAHRKTQNELPI